MHIHIMEASKMTLIVFPGARVSERDHTLKTKEFKIQKTSRIRRVLHTASFDRSMRSLKSDSSILLFLLHFYTIT